MAFQVEARDAKSGKQAEAACPCALSCANGSADLLELSLVTCLFLSHSLSLSLCFSFLLSPFSDGAWLHTKDMKLLVLLCWMQPQRTGRGFFFLVFSLISSFLRLSCRDADASSRFWHCASRGQAARLRVVSLQTWLICKAVRCSSLFSFLCLCELRALSDCVCLRIFAFTGGSG